MFSRFIAASQGPNFRHFSPDHPTLSAVIRPFAYFPWYVREEREQRRATIHPSKSLSPQLSLGTVAKIKEMTVGVLKKPQVNDDEESSVIGGGKQWIPQYPRAPRNSTRCAQEPYRSIQVMANHFQCTHFGRFFAVFCNLPAPVVPH